MVAVSYNQPDAAYRKEPGENQSSLKYILKSPAHYLAAKKRRFAPSVFMDIGSALHCKVLEGEEEFYSRFIQKPSDISLTTKEGREWKEANKGKTILSNSDRDAPWDSVLGMTESLRSLDWFNPEQTDYRKFNELSIYWDSDGVECKGRLDRLVDDGDNLLVLDLKTTDSIEPGVFIKKVVGSMNYIFQAAWYAEAAEIAFKKPAKFIFVAIERAAPWSVGIFEVSPDAMLEGKAQISRARKLLKDCTKTKTWPGPDVSFSMLDLPPWYQSPLTQEEAFVPLF
jgi:hypothetical protein